MHALYDNLLDQVDHPVPEVHAHLDDARTEVLAFPAFPARTSGRLWSNHLSEHLNREIRRRANVVGIFPDRGSIIRLVGASWPNNTRSGPTNAATSASMSFTAADSTSSPAQLRGGQRSDHRRDQRQAPTKNSRRTDLTCLSRSSQGPTAPRHVIDHPR